MTDVIVQLRHLRGVAGFNEKPGFCVGKSREWFRRHGLNWREFTRHGIAAESLIATGDAMALALVEHARLQEAQVDGR